MKVTISGRIMLDSMECHHCKAKIFGSNIDIVDVCETCGAKYELVNTNLSGKDVTAEFKFEGFNCLEQGYFDKCQNTCPAPFMYCKDHCNDAAIQKAENAIKSAEKTVQKEKDKLELIKKSKKTWMVTELSGINDE